MENSSIQFSASSASGSEADSPAFPMMASSGGPLAMWHDLTGDKGETNESSRERLPSGAELQV